MPVVGTMLDHLKLWLIANQCALSAGEHEAMRDNAAGVASLSVEEGKYSAASLVESSTVPLRSARFVPKTVPN